MMSLTQTLPRMPLRLLTLATAALVATAAAQGNPPKVVFRNGSSIAASSLALEGANLVVVSASDGFNAGQSFALQSADHVFGDKPAEIGQGVALLLRGDARKARELLAPVVQSQRPTATIPGNYWLEAARALLVAHALTGDDRKSTELAREIAEATPEQGIDSFASLGKALLLPPLTTKFEDRARALRDLTTDNLPADVRAYASYFLGDLCVKESKGKGALEAFLAVPCEQPTGGLILNAAAELRAAELLAATGLREEAVALATSAQRVSVGTVLSEEAAKRLQRLK